MGAKVYANGMEVSGKASNHKVLGSMPDVCLSPPSPPAGPVPIPYPNFAKASDTTGGSKKVKAGGKEINLKGKSKYKKSKGDEAATRSFGAGLISHSISGAVKHKAGSFDVKVEGSSVVRTLDLTTGNHSNPGDGCVLPDAAGVDIAVAEDPNCAQLRKTVADDKEEFSAAAKDGGKGTAARGLIEGEGKRWNYPSYSRSGKINKKGLAQGVYKFKDHAKTPPTSNMCIPEGKKPLIYKPAGNRSTANHAEAKIIEDISAKFGSQMDGVKLRLSVSKRPCPSCQRAMCRAMECGLTIELCLPEDVKKGSNGQTPKCDKNDKGVGEDSPGPMDSQLPKSGW